MSQKILTQEKANEICSHLEQTADMMGIKLKKDIESIENIEGILVNLKEIGDYGALNGASFMSGIYFGEIIKNYLGGEWIFSEYYNQLALQIGDQTYFPIDKIKKFVNDSDNEGLVFYIQALTSHRN